MVWIYHQASGVLEHDGVVIETGYSGQGKYKNDPSAQALKGLGPVPRGTYSIGNSYEHPDLGPVVMNLLPRAGNEMFHRSAFRIHGDKKTAPGTASHGCIILSRRTREAIAKGYDRELFVTL